MITLVAWCALQAPLVLPVGWEVTAVRDRRMRVERVLRNDADLFDVVQCPERKLKAKRRRGVK